MVGQTVQILQKAYLCKSVEVYREVIKEQESPLQGTKSAGSVSICCLEGYSSPEYLLT